MGSKIVFTLTGTDRVGIVEEVTGSLLRLGGNIETSRMARLGGEFAVLLLVDLPAGKNEELKQAVAGLTALGYKVTTTPTDFSYAQRHAGWLPFRIEVHGADHEGIVHRIAHALAQKGINVESMETGTSRAPNSGALLFTMKALVLAPPDLEEQSLRKELEAAGQEEHIDIFLTATDFSA